MRRFYCELGPSAGRSRITRRIIANRKSTQHQLHHAIQHRRNQEPTRARLLGPKKEVQDCLPGESDCRISSDSLPPPVRDGFGLQRWEPEIFLFRSLPSPPLWSLEQLVHVAWSAVHTCDTVGRGQIRPRLPREADGLAPAAGLFIFSGQLANLQCFLSVMHGSSFWPHFSFSAPAPKNSGRNWGFATWRVTDIASEFIATSLCVFGVRWPGLPGNVEFSRLRSLWMKHDND
jgi:hypothetical protein